MALDLTRFRVRGVGTALPSVVLQNEELGTALGIDPDSITTRTGILERRVAADHEAASTLGALAAREALGRAAVEADSVDLVLLSTYTPDLLLCPTAPAVAELIGARRAGAFDLNGACSGGVTALLTGCSLLDSGAFSRVLVVSSDLTTRYIRPDDPKTRLVFGDGAAALLLERASSGENGWSVLAADVGADGSGAELFCVPVGGSAKLTRVNGHAHPGLPSIEMNGRAIFRFGVEKGAEIVERLCTRAGLEPQQVDWVIPHQANLRIIRSLMERTAIPSARWVINIERYGNTASSSVPIALAELIESGRLTPGSTVLLVAFGAGLTWSGLALRVGSG
ncbi:MAG: ketoacyl-ACP synthase III [Acidobacteriota bacterium]|nr:MAG: ketoacyl-ACP synthase III [Acidobacteriota bacterium]